MTSLTARLAVLCVLVAVLATAIAAVSAGAAAGQALDAHEEHLARLAREAWQAQFAAALDTLDYETQDYATWDDLYRQMPQPDPAWTDINLLPGSHPGSLVGMMAVIDASGTLRGRYRAGHPQGLGPSEGDLAPAETLIALAGRGVADRGLALLGGHPALYVRRPILPSNGAGLPAGLLLGIAYLDRPAVVHRLALPGWDLTWDLHPPPEPRIRRGHHLSLDLPLTAVEGLYGASLAISRDETERIRSRTVLAVYGTGVLAALLAAGLGVVLALHWLRPLRQLARDCGTPGTPLSDGGDLDETRALASALQTLLKAEHAAQHDLAAALDRARHLGAVHRTFLRGISQEIGVPIARLGGLLREAVGRARLTPEHLAEAIEQVELLEIRLGDAAAVADQDPGPATLVVVDLAAWLAEIAEMLRAEAQGFGVVIEVVAEGRLAVPRARLTLVLIDLVANALRASPASGGVEIRSEITAADVIVRVIDHGPGFAPDLAERVAAACQRGQAMPGEPGFGLGLALAIERMRALGGRLDLEANGPGGATVALRVPRI